MERLPKGSAVAGLVARCREHGRKVVLLGTDIDNTLVLSWEKFPGVTPDELIAYAAERLIVVLAVTGIGIEYAVDRIRSGEVPPTEGLCTNVGTQLYWRFDASPPDQEEVHELALPDGRTVWYARDWEFDRLPRDERGFDKEVVLAQAQAGIEAHGAWEENANPDDRAELQLQTGGKELVAGGPYHVGLWAFDNTPDHRRIAAIVGELKARTGQVVVYAEEKNHNSRLAPGEARLKYCVDILPMTKDEAVAHAAELLSADVTIVAGDSGNDFLMLERVGLVKVAVGGSKEDLLLHVREVLASAGTAREREGLREVRRNGQTEYWYLETGERRGPQSLLRALQASETVWNS